MIIEGKELPERVNPNAQPKDDVQQVLKPAPGTQPNVAPERPAQVVANPTLALEKCALGRGSSGKEKGRRARALVCALILRP